MLNVEGKNSPAVEPTVPCCDNCAPELLDQTRPSRPTPKKRNTAVKQGVPNRAVMKALNVWRLKMFKRDFSGAFFTANGFFSNEILELCSAVGPIDDFERLRVVLGGKWCWIDKYGEDLLNELTSLDVPPMKPKPTASKRRAANTNSPINEVANSEDDGDEPPVVNASESPSTATNASIVDADVDQVDPNRRMASTPSASNTPGPSIESAGSKRSRGPEDGHSRRGAKKTRTQEAGGTPTPISAHNDFIDDRPTHNRRMGGHVLNGQTIQPASAIQPVENPYMNLSVLGMGQAAQHAPQQPYYQQPRWYPGYGWWPPANYYSHAYPAPAHIQQQSGAMSYQDMANANVHSQQAPAPAPAVSTSHHPPPPPHI